MSDGRTILLVGDFITDRTWLVGEPSLVERYNSHYSVHPHTLVDPARETDVAGGIGTVARSIAAVTTHDIVVVGAWSYYAETEFQERRKLVPPEGELSKRPISFRRVYEPDFTSVKTRVYLPEPGGARLNYRIDRNSSVCGDPDPKRYTPMEWPDPEDVALLILGDYGYGVLELPEVQTQLRRYVGRHTPIILRSSNKALIETLPWDVLTLNLYHCAKLLDLEQFDTPVTKQVNGECTYHPSLIDALGKMATTALPAKAGDRALLLNLESEGALILHNGHVLPFLLAAPNNENITGVGANDVLLAHFAIGMLAPKPAFQDRLRLGCERAVRASAVFVSRALRLEDIPEWCAPRLEVTANDLERATPILSRPDVSLEQLRGAVRFARAPLERKRILLRDAGWYLEGFHTVDASFGAEIVRLKNRIKEYVSSGTPKRPFLAVLCGDPGAGKSTLAEALGRYSKCEVISANAAQWTSADDLFELCERIRSARMVGRLPLAFIDEVDSPFHNQDLYAKLLAPVWDGTYTVRGQTRALGTPTVFLLAGSNDIWRNADELRDAAKAGTTPKLQDLVSRLTTRPLQIPPLTERMHDVAYLVASQILRKFPRVSNAARGIFDLLNGNNCLHGARSMATVIELFGPLRQERFVGTGDFRWSNEELLMHLGKAPDGWQGNDDAIEIAP
ncbi:MAG TPA: AAA family ATPase [Thermoanaerobaculia bacterium]|nr:AAA family ATPase [Thermoanaerobaculia bacterium]